MLHIINRCSFFEPLALVQALCPPRPRARPLEACENTPLIDINETVTREQVSGAAEPGSSVVDTAVRELMEEVSVEVRPPHACITFQFCGLHHLRTRWISPALPPVILAATTSHAAARRTSMTIACASLCARAPLLLPRICTRFTRPSGQVHWENRRRASSRVSQEPIAALVDIAQRYTHCPPPPSVLIEGHTLLHDNERSFPAFSLYGLENPTTLARQPSFHTSSAP